MSEMTVVSFESRMATEAAGLIARFGGLPIVAPSMREVPLEENSAALDFADRLLNGRIDIAIFLTGVGVRTLFAAIGSRHPKRSVVGALARCICVARGPKPLKALRELGIEPSIAVPEPNTWRELVFELCSRTTLDGKEVAVQEYGVANRELSGLRASPDRRFAWVSSNQLAWPARRSQTFARPS